MLFFVRTSNQIVSLNVKRRAGGGTMEQIIVLANFAYMVHVRQKSKVGTLPWKTANCHSHETSSAHWGFERQQTKTGSKRHTGRASLQIYLFIYLFLFSVERRREQMLANWEGDLVCSWSSVTEKFAMWVLESGMRNKQLSVFRHEEQSFQFVNRWWSRNRPHCADNLASQPLSWWRSGELLCCIWTSVSRH